MTELTSSGVEGDKYNELFMLDVGQGVGLVDSTADIFFAMFFSTFAKKLLSVSAIVDGSETILPSSFNKLPGVMSLRDFILAISLIVFHN